MQTSTKRAVILLSGGLDSATTAALAKSQGYVLYALSFDYGQRHLIELDKAKQIAEAIGVVDHKIATIDLRLFGHSALTDDIEVPKNRDFSKVEDIPLTYVPARNTIFLSFALAYAEVVNVAEIFIGANSVDYSGYPDCRPEYLDAFEKMANLATVIGVKEGNIRIKRPLIDLGKDEIIKLGLSLGLDYSKTISCYDPTKEGFACGSCDACLLRIEGFNKLGRQDPARYINN